MTKNKIYTKNSSTCWLTRAASQVFLNVELPLCITASRARQEQLYDAGLQLCWDQVGLIRHTLQVISGMKNEVMGTGAEPWQQSENGMCMD